MIIYQCDNCGAQSQVLDGWTMLANVGGYEHFDKESCRADYEAHLTADGRGDNDKTPNSSERQLPS